MKSWTPDYIYLLISWKYLEICLFLFLFLLLKDILELLEIEVSIIPRILEILEMTFVIFVIFTKKARAEILRKTHRSMSRDLSYETDSGPKTKTISGAITLDIYSLGWR